MSTPIMTETVTVLKSLAEAYSQEHNQTGFQSWALEALVVEAVREGLITRGCGGELLGMGFHPRERFYADHGVAYALSDDELRLDRESRDRIFRHR